MTGRNARRPRTGRERGPWWRLSEASSGLTVWTLNDRFFASLVYCMLRRVLSEYWQKETEKSKVFLLGGRFGRSLLCPGRAEKKSRGSWPTTGCLPVDRNQLGPDSWRAEKGVWDRTRTRTRTHTHTHTHEIKAPWTARSSALARTWHPARIKIKTMFKRTLCAFRNWKFHGKADDRYQARPIIDIRQIFAWWSAHWPCRETSSCKKHKWPFELCVKLS